MLHRSEPAMKHQDKIHTMCEVTIHYFGSNLKLDYEKFDPRDEVIVDQQHCGGNTLAVFKNKLLPGSKWPAILIVCSRLWLSVLVSGCFVILSVMGTKVNCGFNIMSNYWQIN